MLWNLGPNFHTISRQTLKHLSWNLHGDNFVVEKLIRTENYLLLTARRIYWSVSLMVEVIGFTMQQILLWLIRKIHVFIFLGDFVQ